MSIFRSSFTPEVQNQLKVRQEAIFNRTPQSIQYINSRNSWIRMTSAVDVNGDKGALAKNYVLLGGTLLNNSKLRSGIGNGDQAYSTKTPNGNPHLRGIRPMPGITSIDVKSKSAYGSLRETTVHFQCWDITQLEDLELLYMRPGYTVLIEWGWLPYLDNSNKLITTPPQFYDILDKGATDRTIIFKELFNKSKQSGGNYDAMYGYIKNYSWSARPDGGYDCQVNVISTGEIIESLKINYIRPDVNTSNNGLLNKEISSGAEKNVNSEYGNYYSKNIMAGLWYEAYYLISNLENFNLKGGLLSKGIRISPFYIGDTNNTNGSNTIVSNGKQCYLPLEQVIGIINKYVIPQNIASSTGSILEVSLNKNTYDDNGGDLLCVAHPLQVSADPTVCLISSPLWSGGEIITPAEQAANNDEYKSYVSIATLAYNDFIQGESGRIGKFFDMEAGLDKFEIAFNRINSTAIYSLVNGLLEKNKKGNLEQFLKDNLLSDKTSLNFLKKIQSKFNSTPGLKIEFEEKGVLTDATGKVRVLKKESIKVTGPTSIENFNAVTTIVEKSKQALASLEILKSLNYSFFLNDVYDEIGTIKNVYVNLDFLYKLSLDLNLESQDKKEKNEINLYNYLKALISAIQVSIGNVNSFEIHVDPIDNIARIIDVNYTEPKKSTYDSLFELQVHNLQSVVRSYSLQSQIFPEQSSIIAIGAQSKGGQLGMQNNTMIDFNRSLIDRIIPEKIPPISNNLYNNNGASQLNNGLSKLVFLFANLGKKLPEDINKTDNVSVSYEDGKNSLRDIIVYFQSITSSPGKNRNLIPVKFSFEMDGIGGLVIGHMFKLPNFVLPRGYRGEKGIGSQLGQAITSIGHTLSNNDWVTKIDALNIVLNDEKRLIPFKELDLNKILTNNNNPSSFIPPNLNPENAKNLKQYLESNKIATVKGNELFNGGDLEQGIVGAAEGVLAVIHNRHPDIVLNVTSGNDAFHQNLASKSNHTYGKAIDFTISPVTQDNKNKVNAILAEYQASLGKDNTGGFLFRYIDEYATQSKNATGGHFHISYNVFTKGA